VLRCAQSIHDGLGYRRASSTSAVSTKRTMNVIFFQNRTLTWIKNLTAYSVTLLSTRTNMSIAFAIVAARLAV
jgi:hypothetical protein